MKRVLSIGLAVVLCVCLSGCFSAARKYRRNPPLPRYDGGIAIPGLQGKVEIYRDGYAIPHIFTENEHDLFFAVGYVQAQDRLWEMVLLRAAAEGRLSELFGDLGFPGQEVMGYPLSTAAMDKRQRVMGLKWLGEVGEALLREVNPEIYAQMQAYCDGVNAFIISHQQWEDLPIELRVLRVKPEAWRVADVISFSLFIGSMLCGNLDLELSRYAMIKKYGAELGWDFFPLHDALGPTIVPPDLLKNKLPSPRRLPAGGRPSEEELGNPPPLAADQAIKLMLAESAIKKAFYLHYPEASNNWVVSGKLTESKNAMLANDPHLQHLQPSLFYLLHLKGRGFDVYGASFPGTPYPVLAHTRKLAWGATTTGADVQDLFIETVDRGRPGQYKYQGRWRPFVVRREVIRVRQGSAMSERVIEIKQTVHGPVINDIADLPPDTPPLALRWTGWDFDRDPAVFAALVESRTVEEFMAKFRGLSRGQIKIRNIALMYNLLMKGESVEDFVQAMDMIIVPNQNWVAADSQGHIAYLPGGLVPVRKKGIGVMPVPGESGEFDWAGFIPLMELPYAIDPPRGYMATANNEVVDAEWYPYVFATNYGDGWRAARIEELIQKLAPLSMSDMRAIQNDVLVKRAEWEVPIILAAVDRKKPTDPLIRRAADELRGWDFQADLKATAPVIFFEFNKKLRKNVLEDEVAKKDYQDLLSGGKSDQLIQMWLAKKKAEFFDDKRTKQVEDQDDMIVKSLGQAMAAVEKRYGKNPADRQWGKVHWIKWYDLVGFGPLAELSVGPFPHIGAENTVRNAGTAGFGRWPYKCLGGPVLRHIMDLGDPDHALMVIDGSQSGQWLSPHYSDMHMLWLNSEYVTAVMTPEQVIPAAKYHQTLLPMESPAGQTPPCTQR